MKATNTTIQDIGSKMMKMAQTKYKNIDMREVKKANLWHFWHAIYQEVAYDDSHPRFQGEGRERVFPHQPDYNLYPDNTNDASMQTALQAAFLKVFGFKAI